MVLSRIAYVASIGIVSAACGGKILEDPDASAARAPAPAATSDPASTSSAMSIDDACNRICERNGRCGAWTADCVHRCLDDARAGCGADAWLECYGERVDDGCSVLPPACEPAYCAWAACAGRPLPPYCR